MSFTTTLYSITDEPNKLNKTLPTNGNFTTYCVYKDRTDILNPVITLSANTSQIKGKNYVSISSMFTGVTHYYFISKIDSVNNNVWDVTLHLDVLMTYKSQISNLTGTLDRQENYYNLYLNDPALKKLSYSAIQTKTFPNPILATDYQYFLVVASGTA